jgi:hypothetical protein
MPAKSLHPNSRGEHAQLFLIFAIAILQLDGSTFISAHPQLFKEMAFRSCIT